MIAMVKKQLTDKLKILSDAEILDGASLAALLPGPLAVNSVVYYGYILSGVRGAFVSFFGVLIPTTLLVLGFSVLYYKALGPESLHIDYVIPVIAAIIIGVGINMAKKQIQHKSQFILLVFAFFTSVFAPSVLFLLLSLLVGGVLGFIWYKQQGQALELNRGTHFMPINELILLLAIVMAILSVFYGFSLLTDQVTEVFSLMSVFSGMSLTLFGGGYVIIPIMKQALVTDLGWLSLTEFNTAIGISQVTPGPILSSVTFIGYKQAGITGALAGTMAIFLPSAVLMLLLSHLHQEVKHLASIAAIMTGVRACVIGLIFSGAYTIGIKTFGLEPYPWISFAVALALILFTKLHPALLIGIALAVSFI